MQFDFSSAGRAARDAIAAPAIPFEAIGRRSRAANVRARLQLLAACFALALIAVSTASGVAKKALAGVRIWLSGGKATIAVSSFEFIRDPLPDDARRIIASASFAPVLPTRFPRGTHVSMLMYSPSDNPDTITLRYVNDQTGYHLGLTAVATRTIEMGTPAPSTGLSSAPYSWQVGDETIVIPRQDMNVAQIDLLKSDVSSAKPGVLPASLLRSVIVLGAPPPLADAVQTYAHRGSVLIGSQFLAEIPRLASAKRPLLDSRIVTLTNVPSERGAPDYKKATYHWSSRVAISADGVKAVNAVLRARATKCTCAVLYSGEAAGEYRVALVPYSSPLAPIRYTVSKATLSVHAQTASAK